MWGHVQPIARTTARSLEPSHEHGAQGPGRENTSAHGPAIPLLTQKALGGGGEAGRVPVGPASPRGQLHRWEQSCGVDMAVGAQPLGEGVFGDVLGASLHQGLCVLAG